MVMRISLKRTVSKLVSRSTSPVGNTSLVDKHPLGWPKLAAFQNSGDSVSIYRRFGDTHARVLLHLEAEITSLEEQLSETDTADSKTESMHYRLKRNEFHEGWDRSQKDLIDKLRITLLQYGNHSGKYYWSSTQIFLASYKRN